jgi:molybdopterin converting factor small subunit
MQVRVSFYSFFTELAGCASVQQTIPEGSTLDALLNQVVERFPKLAGMRKSTLIAVGLEYQPPEYVLKDGDEVSLFPPVQGG